MIESNAILAYQSIYCMCFVCVSTSVGMCLFTVLVTIIGID